MNRTSSANRDGPCHENVSCTWAATLTRLQLTSGYFLIRVKQILHYNCFYASFEETIKS